MLRRPHHHARTRRGFTLVELMVTIAVLAVALAVAAPTFSTQLGNYRVRAAAEAMINGLNYARTEAARRNTPVSFELGASGSGWSVVSGGNTLLERADGDSSGVTTASSTASRTVTFRPTGLVDTSGTRLEQVTVTSALPGTESRRIDIFGGGLIRMCDPGITTADDPRRC